jgi:DNA-binding response OmpR family regulator
LIADEPGIVKILGMRLRANGFQIITAHDGAMAIALAQHEKPDRPEKFLQRREVIRIF